jgi:hypothetical protein
MLELLGCLQYEDRPIVTSEPYRFKRPVYNNRLALITLLHQSISCYLFYFICQKKVMKLAYFSKNQMKEDEMVGYIACLREARSIVYSISV